MTRSTSTFIHADIEGLSSDFNVIEVLSVSGHNILARGKRYGRWFLLKGLRPEVAGDSVYQQMLRKEFEILISLQHPHIVQAYGLEETEGLGLCIVMEWVDGQTLEATLRGRGQQESGDAAGVGGLSLSERRRVVDELADALAATHALGIVHRDLKPSNIMITRSGHSVKLIDFGLADSDTHAILKQPAGTPDYMSAEQQTQSLPDVRNDIYSLGLILQQLGLGLRYAGIVRRCLQPIGHRYQNIAQLQDAIRRRRTLGRRLWIAAVVLVAVMAEGLLIYKLGDVSTTNAELQQHSHVQRGLQMGRAAIDAAIRQQEVDIHLDTLSRWAYHWPDLQERMFAVNEAVYTYTEKLEATYSDKEIAQIRDELLAYWKAWHDRTIERIRAAK